MEIIIKNFTPHYNVALGKVITSQKQYNEEIKRGGYIPYEQAQEVVANNLERRKKFSVSDECDVRTKNICDRGRKDGKARLNDSDIEFMKKSMTFKNPLPEHYQGKTEGGFL